jgi:hypothetical protein
MQNMETHTCYIMMLRKLSTFYQLPNNYAPWVRVTLKHILVGESKDMESLIYLSIGHGN